ncbi:MAG TPA: NmrA family NAD(P)-binding protein [Streptosporangiaceae bacterium]
MNKQTILVIGATGNVGRHIVSQLADAGLTVKALTRDPERADLPAGVMKVTGDLADPGSLRAAAQGADAAFLLWPFRTAEGADAAAAALASEVRHIVYLSAISVRDGGTPEENGMWGQVEQAIERSGATWTFLRAGGFATNTLGWAGDVATRGVVRWVHGGAARSLIHERDIADVAVRALTGGKHAGARYVLTGPEAVTQADQARIIGEVTGLPVTWEEAPADEVAGQLAAFTGDRAFADHAIAYWGSLIDQPEQVTGEVEAITGVPARTFREWVEDHAGEFRPHAPADVAGRYVALLRKGDLAAALSLLAPDVVRVAPLEAAGGGAAGLRGVDAIMSNASTQTSGYEIREVTVDGPYLVGDQFAVRFGFDEVRVADGHSQTTRKLSLYTVRDGAIAREEVYYHTAPHA